MTDMDMKNNTTDRKCFHCLRIPCDCEKPATDIHCSDQSGSGRLFEIGLELQQCAKAWEGEARLIGNIKASDLLAMAKDYTRLRLQAGVQGDQNRENTRD